MNNKIIKYSKISLSDDEITGGIYKQYFGGKDEKWETRGAFQLALLQHWGLKPHHKLLDVGCGVLRGGEHFIRYLDRGSYFGVDYNGDFIRAAKLVVQKDRQLAEKEPFLGAMNDFDFSKISAQFDFAIVFSVLNHCNEGECNGFFRNILHVVKDGTKIYITHARDVAPLFRPSAHLQLNARIDSARDLPDTLDPNKWSYSSPTDNFFPVLELVGRGNPGEAIRKGSDNAANTGQRLPTRKGLGARLREQDGDTPRTRIFIMGCGRSGTWLLTGIMSTFEDIFLLAEEGPFMRFEYITAKQSVHVAKRDYQSYGRVNLIPHEIGILAAIRHPFDVLTSFHPGIDRKYHISPLRWNLEMQALRWLLETRRPKTKIIRYEDLVTNPDAQQKAIADYFGLRIRVPARDYQLTFRASQRASKAMHGLRQPDTNSIGRWKRDAEAVSYIASIESYLRPQLDWVSATFGYNTRL